MAFNTAQGVRNVAICVVAGLAAWYFLGGGQEKNQAAQQRAATAQVADTMRDIYDQVSKDAIDQYGIAKRQGTPVDICVHAGLVSAAYIQAKDEANYRVWKAKELEDCDRAGVPR